MSETFLTFKRFNDKGIADVLVERLKLFNIVYEVEDSDKFFDPSFARNELQREIHIKLQPQDFSVAQRELDNYYREQISTVDKDYYLFDFSDEELREILIRPDEWGDFDNQLAQYILKERGKEIQPQVVEKLKEQRNDYLARPSVSAGVWIPLGYVFSVLGGFIGIFIGWHLLKSKKTLPDGRSVFTFRESDRTNGKIIFIVGCIVFPVGFIFKLWLKANGYD